jgi:hypothetical protein
MPNTVPTPCPYCASTGGRILIGSQTVMTIACSNCGRTWAIDLKTLSPQVREQLAAALRDTEHD